MTTVIGGGEHLQILWADDALNQFYISNYDIKVNACHILWLDL